MENDTTQKTLGEINVDAINQWAEKHCGGCSWRWATIPQNYRDSYEAGAKAVVAEYQTRQPATISGELSVEEVKKAWNDTVEADNWTGFHEFSHTYQLSVIRFANRLLASRPVAPTYHKTADKPPTEADADKSGFVLAHDKIRWLAALYTFVCSNPDLYSQWMPMLAAPVPPVSEEDAAFDEWISAQHLGEYDLIALRKSWDAAKAYFESKKDLGK